MNNISRTLLQLPVYIYSGTDSSIHINQYIGSSFTIDNVMKTDVGIVQQTSYPKDGKIAITINPEDVKTFTIYLRIPDRQVSMLYQPDKILNGYLSFKLNGKAFKPSMYKGYAVIEREWKKGDRIELEIPMEVQKIYSVPEVKENRGKVAFQYGPLVYALEKTDIGGKDPAEISVNKNIPLSLNYDKSLLGGVWTISGKLNDGSVFKAIPFYARMNREIPGKYAVWLNEK
jgi:hypothetical protein